MKTKRLTLQAYSSLGIALLSQTNSDAQTVVKDPDPDLRIMNWREDTLQHDTITIDIDENGIDDLIFTYEASDDVWLIDTEVKAQCADAVIAFGATDDFPWLYGVDAGYIIGNDLSWTKTYIELNYFDASLIVSTVSTTSWNFIGIDRYLPIKLKLSGEEHFGWVRMSSAIIEDEDYAYHRKTGSPLTIFEIGYNATPDEDIVCNTNQLKERVSIKFPTLIDDIDANDIRDLSFQFYAEDTLDFSELRFFLVPSREDAVNFSMDQALALEDSRFLRISADSIVSGVTNIFQLPLSLSDIKGNEFSSDSYYTGFYLKIPADVDTTALTLSSPLNVIKPQLQQCHLDISNLDLYFNDAGFFEISFDANPLDSDVTAYGAALAEDWVLTYSGWGDDYFNDFDWDAIDFSGIIPIPKTGAFEYIKSLEELTVDVYGDPIDSGDIFNPIILGYADGYYRDLTCLSTKKVYLEYPQISPDFILTANNTEIKIIQSNTTSFSVINTQIYTNDYTLELENITGERVETETITDQNQTFNFPSLPDGVYIAIIKQNTITVAVAKVLLQK